MNKILLIIKQIVVLLAVYIFPTCTALIFEHLLDSNSSIVSDFLIVPLNLIGAVFSVIVFKKENISEIKVLNPFKAEYIAILGMGLTFKLVIMYLFYFVSLIDFTNIHKISVLEFISAVTFAPISEELVFRGILTGIIKNKYPETKTTNIIVVLITSVIWAFGHLYGFSLVTVMLVADGVIIGIIYSKTRNIISCILYHTANNLSVLSLNYLNSRYYLISFVLSTIILGLSLFYLFKFYNIRRNDEVLLHKTT